jgi:deoxyribodipyrimidine photolyase-like uncharacterized protein
MRRSIRSKLPRMDDLEAIRQLKARYFRLMDTKQWEDWRECFTADAELHTLPNPDQRFIGRDQIVQRVSEILADSVTVHHGHMPEIELQGSDRATGIWAMDDWVDMPALSLRGFGHYHDEYVKQAGLWRIRHSRLTRLRVDIERKDPPA